MCLIRQIMSAQHAVSAFNPVQRFVFINIMHIDPLVCFRSQISQGVRLSLIHSMIGYLFPMILIQTTCPWDRSSNRTGLIYVHSPVVENESTSCVSFVLSLIETFGGRILLKMLNCLSWHLLKFTFQSLQSLSERGTELLIIATYCMCSHPNISSRLVVLTQTHFAELLLTSLQSQSNYPFDRSGYISLKQDGCSHKSWQKLKAVKRSGGILVHSNLMSNDIGFLAQIRCNSNISHSYQFEVKILARLLCQWKRDMVLCGRTLWW